MYKSLLLILIFVLVFLLGFTTRFVYPDIGKKQPASTTHKTQIIPTITPLPDLKYEKLAGLLENEYLALKRKFLRGQNVSYSMGIKINPFHPDWTCEESGFTNEGFVVSCKQKKLMITKLRFIPLLWKPIRDMTCFLAKRAEGAIII